MAAAKVAKSAATFSTMLKGYGRQQRGDVVDGLLRHMRAQGVRADLVLVNTAVDAFVRAGDLPRGSCTRGGSLQYSSSSVFDGSSSKIHSELPKTPSKPSGIHQIIMTYEYTKEDYLKRAVSLRRSAL